MDKKIAMFCLFALIAIFVIPSVPRAASFDCSKARTKTEKAICDDPILSKLDEDMAAAYIKALKTSDSDAVKKGQRKWLKEILALCIEDKVCIKNTYENRLHQLESSAIEERKQSQFIGTWCTNPCFYGSTSRPWDLPCNFEITDDEFRWTQWNDWNKRFARKYEVIRQSEGEETILIFGGGANEWYAHESLLNAKHRLTLSSNHSNQFAGDSIKLDEESWSEKEQRWKSSGSMYITRIDPSLVEDQTMTFLHSKSATERKEALHKINLQTHPERDKYNGIGLRDQSPEVRDIAAGFLRGEPNHFVPLLINVMANDPDAKVRASAGYSLSHFYTDNGSEGDRYIKPLEDNLDNLFIGLKRVETMRSVVEILGSRYTGGSFAPCFMSTKNREKVLKTLRSQADEWGKNRASWTNELSMADNEINRAIHNLAKCNLTN